MPQFMDIHRNMTGLTADDLLTAHNADLKIQDSEDVVFKQAWASPDDGMIFCLSEGPDSEAVKRIHERAGHATNEIHEVPLVV